MHSKISDEELLLELLRHLDELGVKASVSEGHPVFTPPPPVQYQLAIAGLNKKRKAMLVGIIKSKETA